MTTRQLNWTARKRIARSEVAITLRQDPDGTCFAAALAQGDLGLPQEAQVVIEAYRQTTLMRFDCGTVGEFGPRASTVLTEFQPPEGVLFRVKVLGSGTQAGMILAEADGIHAVAPGEANVAHESLLPTRGDDIGDEAWRLDFSGDAPELLFSNRSGDWRGLARSPHFTWLVYPEILRQILTRCMEDGVPDADDADWRSRWVRFAGTLSGMTLLKEGADEQEREDWVGDAVAAFCRAQRFRERFASQLFEETER